MINIKVIGKIKNKLNSMNTKKRLIIIYLIVGLLPICLLSSFAIYQYYSIQFKEADKRLKSSNKRIANNLFYITQLTSKVSDYLTFDSELRGLLLDVYYSYDDFYKKSSKYTNIDLFLQCNNQFSNITIYTDNSTIYSCNHFSPINADIKEEAWFPKYNLDAFRNSWNYVNNKYILGISNLCFVSKIPLSKINSYAITVISISYNFISSICYDNEIGYIISLENGTIVSADNFNLVGKNMNELPRFAVKKEQLNTSYMSSSSDFIYYSSVKASSNSQMFHIYSYDSKVYSKTMSVCMTCCFIVTFLMIFPIILIIIFSVNFSIRINILKSQMHNIASGNLQIEEKFGGNDELHELYVDMKTTVCSINKLNRDIYEGKIKQQAQENNYHKLKYDLLVKQINPHFLFNTLETIRMKASLNDDFEVEYITKRLANILRYSLNVSDNLVTLKVELDFIKKYLEIQHFRFLDRINYSISVSPEINPEACYILPLIIQPFIENALIHGFSMTSSDGYIRISILVKNNFLNIIISDNGKGVSREKLKKLQDTLNCKEPIIPTSNIGIYNTYQRLKLYYGKNFNLEISNNNNCGLSINILIPKQTKG